MLKGRERGGWFASRGSCRNCKPAGFCCHRANRKPLLRVPGVLRGSSLFEDAAIARSDDLPRQEVTRKKFYVSLTDSRNFFRISSSHFRSQKTKPFEEGAVHVQDESHSIDSRANTRLQPTPQPCPIRKYQWRCLCHDQQRQQQSDHRLHSQLRRFSQRTSHLQHKRSRKRGCHRPTRFARISHALPRSLLPPRRERGQR